VSLHGARPWHPQNHSHVFVSRERETPRRKAVASISVFTQSRQLTFLIEVNFVIYLSFFI